MKTQLHDQLEPADLQKRSKELDLREEYITRREEIFDIPGKESQIQVLDERIKYKQDEVTKLDDKIAVLQINYQKLQTDAARAKETIEEDRLGIDALKETIAAELASQQTKTQTLRSEASDLEGSIKERRVYYDNQEASIDLVAREANDRLNELRFEADNIEARKGRYLEEIVRHDQEKTFLVSEVSELEAKLSKLSETYEERAAEYCSKLQALSIEVGNKKAELDTQGELAQARVNALASREKVLGIKERAVDERSRSLDSKEKFLRSRYQTDGQNFDVSL